MFSLLTPDNSSVLYLYRPNQTEIQNVRPNQIAFADIDKKMHEDQMAWAMGRVDALREFDPKKTERYLEAEAKPKEEFYEGRKQDTLIHIYWDEKYNLAGGKTWYGIFTDVAKMTLLITSSKMLRLLSKSVTLVSLPL